MSTPSLGRIAKESGGWSIALSVLMILTGVLAIMIPPVAGIAVLIIVAWLLMFSGAAHLVFDSTNDRGWIAGSGQPDWRDRIVTDLGTFGGSNSNVAES